MTRAVPVVAVLASAAVALAACGGSVAPSTNEDVKVHVVVASDLSLHGPTSAVSQSANKMLELYLASINNTVGHFTVGLTTHDSYPQDAGPVDEACARNAQLHTTSIGEVAVLGTDRADCDRIQVPILGQAEGGPMLMVTPAVTDPGLTTTWDPGEPDKYYPGGGRNYARVLPIDSRQGAAIAAAAGKQFGLKKCYVVNDGTTYGQGVALSFVSAADANGVEVLGSDPWDPAASSYRDLFEQIKATRPDCIVLSGSAELNGDQLVRDQVAVFGGLDAVKVLASAGFSGNADFDALPEAAGVYLTVPGVPLAELKQASPVAARLIAAYQTEYGALPPAEALYAVAALQVILSAVESSDGTRKGVTDQVFSGDGISVEASASVLGQDLSIDPATGDIITADLSLLRILAGREVFITTLTVK